jgi:hypothetical protein
MSELVTRPLSEVPPRRPTVEIVGRCVHIRTDWHRQLLAPRSYDIPLEALDTPLKLLARVHHLSGKVWFDHHVCRDLVSLVAGHFG